jgi:hypothetical protein
VRAVPVEATQAQAALLERDDAPPVSAAYVCATRESGALSAALVLDRLLPGTVDPFRVLVRDSDDGVGRAIASGVEGLKRARPFGVLTGTLTPELVRHGSRELLAMAKHSQYLRSERTRGLEPAGSESLRDWSELPESLRESNRAFANSVGEVLEAAGCVLVPAPLKSPDEPLFEFAEEEIERLAPREHERWCRDLEADGWRRADGDGKDPDAKRHPALRPWDELGEVDREKDREAIRELPRMLVRAGFEIYAPGRQAVAKRPSVRSGRTSPTRSRKIR